MADNYDHLKAQKDRIERQQAVAAQRVECARIKSFLKQKGMATSNLRHATNYAEAAAMIDEYVAALEATIPPDVGVMADREADRLADIKARAEQATPGPWKDDGRGTYIFGPNGQMVAEVRGWGYLTGAGGLNLSEDEAIKVQETVGAFIANAREDIPYLIARIATLEAEREARNAIKMPSDDYVNGYQRGAEDCRGSVAKMDAMAEQIAILRAERDAIQRRVRELERVATEAHYQMRVAVAPSNDYTDALDALDATLFSAEAVSVTQQRDARLTPAQVRERIETLLRLNGITTFQDIQNSALHSAIALFPDQEPTPDAR